MPWSGATGATSDGDKAAWPVMSADTRPLIVHVIHRLVMGGMENGVVNLINHLPESEFRHAVVCVEHASDFRQRIRRADVEIVEMHRSKTGAMGLRRNLLAYFRRKRPAVVHSRNLSGLDALLPALLAGVRGRIHSEHGWEAEDLHGKAWKTLLLRRLHTPLVTRYVSVSRDLGRFLSAQVGIADRRISVICNGVDTDVFCPGPVAADLGLPADFQRPEVVRVGTVGRLQAVKDQATLVAAVAVAVQRQAALRDRLRLVLVGDGPLARDLQDQAEQLGIGDICFFAGASERVSAWLRALHVLVLPSLNEGISNTLLEAMAAGMPTLATAVGGNLELVEDGVTGAFFTPGDVTCLSQLLERYVDDHTMRQAQGLAARERAVTQFSLHAMLANYGQLYRTQSGMAPRKQLAAG